MVIDKAMFRKIEYYLHNINDEIAKAETANAELRAELLNKVSGGIADASAGATGYVNDKVSKHALKLAEYSNQIDMLRLWLKVIGEAREYFCDRKENILFLKFYGKSKTIKGLAEDENINRQCLDEWRERIVIYIAFKAIERKILYVR